MISFHIGNDRRKRDKGDSVRNPNDIYDFVIPPLDQLLGSIPMGGSDDDVASGRGFSNTDRFQFQYEISKILDEREWQEDMFNRYQSIPAQVRQMQEAGLNPALMYQSGASPGTMSSTGASDGSPVNTSGRSPLRAIDKASAILQMLTGLGSVASHIGKSVSDIIRNRSLNEVSVSQAENYKADTDLKYQQADGQMLDNISKSIDLEFKRYNAQLDQMYKEDTINKIRAEIKNLDEDTLLKTKTIEVNGKQIDLMTQQISESEQREYLLQMQGMLTRIQKDQQERLGQLQQELLAAQAMMTNAQSVVVKEQQTKAYAESQIAILEYIKQQKLMDGGYVDELLKEMRQGRKRRNADAVVGNICNVLNSIAGFIPTAGGSSYSPTSSTSISY